MADERKYIDRGKDAPSTMLTPRTLQLAQAQAEEFRKRAEGAEARADKNARDCADMFLKLREAEAARDVIITEAQAVELLRRLIEEAGSIRRLADGDNSFVGVISNVLQGKRPVTMPQILDLLGLEIVFRLKGRS